MDLLSVDANSYDVIFVESVVRGYSRIKLVTPDLVIVLLEIDDVAACQLLSLLNIDTDTSGIPVVIWTIRREESEFEDIVAEVNRDSSAQTVAIQMN